MYIVHIHVYVHVTLKPLWLYVVQYTGMFFSQCMFFQCIRSLLVCYVHDFPCIYSVFLRLKEGKFWCVAAYTSCSRDYHFILT